MCLIKYVGVCVLLGCLVLGICMYVCCLCVVIVLCVCDVNRCLHGVHSFVYHCVRVVYVCSLCVV